MFYNENILFNDVTHIKIAVDINVDKSTVVNNQNTIHRLIIFKIYKKFDKKCVLKIFGEEKIINSPSRIQSHGLQISNKHSKPLH